MDEIVNLQYYVVKIFCNHCEFNLIWFEITMCIIKLETCYLQKFAPKTHNLKSTLMKDYMKELAIGENQLKISQTSYISHLALGLCFIMHECDAFVSIQQYTTRQHVEGGQQKYLIMKVIKNFAFTSLATIKILTTSQHIVLTIHKPNET